MSIHLFSKYLVNTCYVPGSDPVDNEIVTALKELPHDVETMTNQCDECDMKDALCVGRRGGGHSSGKISQILRLLGYLQDE